MGHRIQTDRAPGITAAPASTTDERRTTLRLAASYLAVFALVIISLSVLAYIFIAENYRDLLGPALDTPEGRLGLARALQKVGTGIALLDVALMLAVGAASYALGRAAVRPLIAAREREARFAADMAHELRTPLGVIASVAQAAPHRGAGEQTEAFATIARTAVEGGALVSDLLLLARGDDTHALIREPVDLAAIARDVVSDVRSTAAERRIDILVEAQSALIMGDERRLRALVRNLLDNALRYAAHTITVRVAAVANCAHLVICDDGPGIAPEVRATLFERFTKAADSTGSGLGLAICRWVARAHGGDINLGPAAEFIVRIPLGRFPRTMGPDVEPATGEG